jgi:glycosyltransferase involved in cell wall biosynthesis
VTISAPIYINGKFLCQKATGVQKFAFGISLALQKNHPDIIIITPKGNYNHHGFIVKQYGWGNGFFWEQFWLPVYIWFHPHSLLINFCNTAPLLIKNQIATIHDLAFRKNKNWFSPTFRRWYNFLIPRLCKRSYKILTVSEFIKKEISEEFFIVPEKITVTPNGIPEIEFDEKNPYPFRYLFLTGIYNPRKNASFIISQLPEIKKRNYHIIGVGADTDIYGYTEFDQDENLHLFRYVDERQYYTLMKHAAALVFPSNYEGFGIPVLEAITLGTPVIIPDTQVYRESFGELPFYYIADDISSFLKSLDQINIHTPATNELLHLKNKFNFDKSSDILSELLQHYQL